MKVLTKKEMTKLRKNSLRALQKASREELLLHINVIYTSEAVYVKKHEQELHTLRQQIKLLTPKIKLTKSQTATLAYVAMKCEIITISPSTGSTPLKNLVKLGLVEVNDCSWGGDKQLVWKLTKAGQSYLKTIENQGVELLIEFGWH
jgi:hypothetical protein